MRKYAILEIIGGFIGIISAAILCLLALFEKLSHWPFVISMSGITVGIFMATYGIIAITVKGYGDTKLTELLEIK